MNRIIQIAGAAVLVVALCLLAGGRAAAGDSVANLKRQLESDDFRVRAQAALSLGRSGSSQAVSPLCRALQDEKASVRVAAAWGLGKLKKGGTTCLKKRLKQEKSSAVKKKIERALRRITAATNVEISGSTKYYLAIGRTKDNTGRGSMEVDKLVRSSMRRASSAVDHSVVAPPGETAEQASQRLRKHKQVDGYLLNPVVHRPEYEGGSLTVRLDVLCYSYPHKVLKGTVSRTAKLAGVGSRDASKENELIEALSTSAMEQVAQLVPQIRK